MSTKNEKTQENIEEEDTVEEEKEDLVDVNVAVLKSDMLALKEENDELKAKLEILKKKYGQAVDLIEKDTKSRLIAEIAPRTTVPKEVLAQLSVEQLKDRQKILDTAKVPAYKSGTALTSIKDSPRMKLDNKYKEYMKRIKEKNK